jgi:hypothetical protein
MPIPRVIGIETEYGIARRSAETRKIYAAQQQILDSTRIVSSVFPQIEWDYFSETELPVLTDGRTLEDIGNTVLTNGARLYEDHGHPEYATPECTNPIQAVVYDKAGERILNLARISANRELTRSYRRSQDEIVIYKNNADVMGHSFGCHENYLVERRTPWTRIRDYLMPFLVTRQIFTGAGKVGLQDPDFSDKTPTPKPPVIGGKAGSERYSHGNARTEKTEPRPGGDSGAENRAVYQLSQRPDFFRREEGLQTTSHRPLINTRDEPHADPDRYRRLHVIVGDANLAPWSTYLKVGTTMLVLDLIEDGLIAEEVVIRDPVRTFRSISQDQDWNWLVTFGSGGVGTAVDHQEIYLNRAKQHYSSDPTKGEIIKKWESVLDALRRQDIDGLSDKLDHAIKRFVIEREMKRHGWDLSSPQVQKLDLRYHSVNPDESIYDLLEKRGHIDTLGITEGDIDHAMRNPPEDTRAYFRGKCIERFTDHVVAANWDLIDIENSNGEIVRIPMNDPFKGTESLTGSILGHSRTVKDLLGQL